MDKIIELSVEDFKAVKKADISLNGITVVSGINGCGKSSLSQLLYYSFYYANQYEDIVDELLYRDLFWYADVLKQIEYTIRDVFPDKTFKIEDASVKNVELYLEYIKDLFSRFLSYDEVIKDNADDKTINSLNRIIRIVRDALNDKSQDGLEKLLDKIYDEIVNIFNSALVRLKKRDYSLLEDSMLYSMKQTLPERWTIKEYGVPFVGMEASVVPLLHYIKRVAYIDTPMIVGSQQVNGKDYWKHLTSLLNNNSDAGQNTPLYESFTFIMNGESIVSEDGIRSPQLAYKRSDGRIFDLSECATGIKSFSILQLLLKNGFLQKDTLLIIDEPEAHLHPQWIVEYARMIVMLHKEIGVKFFIASHSTDMVSAIRYIAAKQEIQDSLNFYLAEDSEDSPYRYTYRDLGLDIDPIFKSFNKSFDKIDEYGVYD